MELSIVTTDFLREEPRRSEELPPDESGSGSTRSIDALHPPTDLILPKREGLLPRKEVIQPHLPVQLPCYDFVPVTDPTLGAYFPEGLAQRLQVLPTSMT